MFAWCGYECLDFWSYLISSSSRRAIYKVFLKMVAYSLEMRINVESFCLDIARDHRAEFERPSHRDNHQAMIEKLTSPSGIPYWHFKADLMLQRLTITCVSCTRINHGILRLGPRKKGLQISLNPTPIIHKDKATNCNRTNSKNMYRANRSSHV